MTESIWVAIIAFLGGVIAAIIPSVIQIRRWASDAQLVKAQAAEADARAAQATADAERIKREGKTTEAQTAAALVGAAGKLVEDYLTSTQNLKLQVGELQSGLAATRFEHSAQIEQMRIAHKKELDSLREQYEQDRESMQRQVTALSVRNAELERQLIAAQSREVELTKEVDKLRAAMNRIREKG